MPIQNEQLIGRFKKLLRPNDFLKEESVILKPYLKFLEKSYFEKSLSSIEIISLFVILYQYFRVKDYPFQKNPINRSRIQINKEFPLEFTFIPSLDLETNYISEFLRLYSFRYLPNSIRDVLFDAFYNDRFVLVNYLPDSKEMLELQSCGKRYITIDFENAFNGSLIEEKRDAFEFVLHDLEHAYCFFKKENDYERQIAFFSSVNKNYHLLEPILKESEQFRKDFDYCVSDMNSHPDHLISYFKAILIKYFLIKNKKSEKDFLSSSELIPMNEILNPIESDLFSFEHNGSRES
ncbi:MAG TPA: hypothetical protein PK079_15945 [Leptospiraceae bacterium]|nr:hypothetical protein [Leptospiraceae bacterium]HMW08285.1 hypothetical protein [Leptospiraceae bacterium]HMX33122.1 hypothetical protein [Leptospiraceae bacterium]HMY34003.1 hypothetical protein [Leptospiraceae bacterium]HMZ63071.1 hypothetical protein [Leptospiraceae bacterium]